MSIAIITACFGSYVRPPAQQCPQDIDVRWYAFSEKTQFPQPPWQFEQAPPPAVGTHPRMAAKRYKCMPWEFIEEDLSIWIDSNTRVLSPSFAREALDAMHDGVAAFQHPDRDCIYAEADASLRLQPRKYSRQEIGAQVEHYLSLGHPAQAGLFATGTIARDHNAPKIRELGERWFEENERWSYQDQISFPVVCAELGIEPGIFPMRQIGEPGHFGNRWEEICPHRGRS